VLQCFHYLLMSQLRVTFLLISHFYIFASHPEVVKTAKSFTVCNIFPSILKHLFHIEVYVLLIFPSPRICCNIL
jgi:hypothetical protein